MTKDLNRKALYDLVWSKPMSTIAKDYGLSDRGMAKLCERNSIPVPPRGYWAKKAAGQKVSKAPLLVFDEKKPDTAILLREAQPVAVLAATLHKKEAPGLPASVQEAIARESLPENLIKVSATMHSPHRIVDGWIKTEEHEAALDKKFGRTSYRPAITPLDRRTWRILSTLLKELEVRGFKISEENKLNDYHKELWISLEYDKVSIHINERIRQYRRELAAKEKEDRYSSSSQKWTQVKEPTGKLEIILEPGGNSYSKIKIQEDDNRPLEHMLNDVVIKIIEAMWTEKSSRLKRQEEERERQKEAQARHLREQAAAQEQQRKINLGKKAASWKRAQVLRDYIAAVEQARDQGRLQADETEFISWRAWAMNHADSLDYIVNGNPLISLSGSPEDIDDDEEEPPGYGASSGSFRSWHPGRKWYHQ